ncbi:flagellar assembly protein T N-terminal domain-containing protein [Cereibacter sphaeroides]|uniref:flagellar assembly protein T N-terminal domain-containing protein n=1 Tax=Cereibacter sphaeroides TaxID=1063 RepID=UPI001F1B5C24|nr:flagellar assembly protein T N-terminal domain-containing protein [Cereibacter sphaeroides]MCE6961942.1 flagellar assembly protein T N-terminal domain-containing protein [Cereibacter sphaeroides]MCE6970717.1 flagellar assembly protein T N-terminal domain-containing protein [Cereibacter sphaeroides]MCE6975687.1 flagellar assembly protein T N-terminal domain-containing protein [Cereibacter sphaeroides]
MRWLALLLALALGAPATAEQPIRVEAVGFGTLTSTADRDAARRRAVADALLAAALAGGAEVSGHSATNRGIVTSDVAVVRTVGRILEHQILAEDLSGSVWRVRISAVVGEGTGPLCPIRTLIVTAYAPEVQVDPHAPEWSGELAGTIARRLVEGLARHPAVSLARVTDRDMPRRSRAGDAFDYQVLTQGTLRLPGNGHGFTPVIRLRRIAGPKLELDLELRLAASDGTVAVQRFVRRIRLPAPSLLGGLAVLAQPQREAMAAALLDGADRALAALLDREGCEPVSARLATAGGLLEVPVGRANGLTPGSLAFTADTLGSTRILEVAELRSASARLRPLDPTVGIAQLAGRRVQFVETGR